MNSKCRWFVLNPKRASITAISHELLKTNSARNPLQAQYLYGGGVSPSQRTPTYSTRKLNHLTLLDHGNQRHIKRFTVQLSPVQNLLGSCLSPRKNDASESKWKLVLEHVVVTILQKEISLLYIYI